MTPERLQEIKEKLWLDDSIVSATIISELIAAIEKSWAIKDKKENLLELIRVKAMQTGWMEHLTDCLHEALNQ